MRLSFSSRMAEPTSHFDALLDTNEGQLAVDVAETPTEIIIITAVAGIDENALSVSVEDDVVTIRGTREAVALPPAATIHYAECFWGPFSRSIILPCPVAVDHAKALFNNGVLTLRLPKRIRDRHIPIERV